jgi:chemotaxis signal transduction protein
MAAHMLTAPHTLLLFSAAGHHLALPVAQISEVVPAFEMKSAPGLSARLAGLISFRGRVLPVIDCAMIIDGSRTIMHHQHSFIIARGEQQEAALLVEQVDDLVTLHEADCASESFLHAGEKRFQRIAMHGKEMVLVLDIDTCLRVPGGSNVSAREAQVILEERK